MSEWAELEPDQTRHIHLYVSKEEMDAGSEDAEKHYWFAEEITPNDSGDMKWQVRFARGKPMARPTND